VLPALVLSLLGTALASGMEFSSRIVNGTLTAAHPTVGALLVISRTGDGSISTLCSGTLIGCSTFVTAAHCVCPDTSNFSACVRGGILPPQRLRVFLQHAGFFNVLGVLVNPEFDLGKGGDLAVLDLAQPVTGIAGSPVTIDEPVQPGVVGTIAGFGRTGGDPDVNANAGNKRDGTVVTAACASGVSNDNYLCWDFLGEGSNTCQGDSGGPLFVAGDVLAGVTSGGTSGSCLAPDMGYNTSIFRYHEWLLSILDADQAMLSCGGVPAVGTAGTSVLASSGTLTQLMPRADLEFVVPPGATQLRVALNGQLFGRVGGFETRNEFDLVVRAGEPPTPVRFDCRDARLGPFGYCQIDMPAPGTWYAGARQTRGTGDFQLTVTVVGGSACIGDCSAQGAVTIDDLLKGVNIVLGLAPLESCPAFAATGQPVTVDDLLLAVSNALEGCPEA
jgi:hypothetical protein